MVLDVYASSEFLTFFASFEARRSNMSTKWVIVSIFVAVVLATGMVIFLRRRSTAGGGATGGGWGFTLPAMSPMTWRFLAALTTFLVVNAVVAVILPSLGRVIGAQGSEFLAAMEILLLIFLILAWMGNHSHATTQWGLGILFVVLAAGTLISATSAHSNARRAEAVATREVATQTPQETPTGKWVKELVIQPGERGTFVSVLGEGFRKFGKGCVGARVELKDGSWDYATLPNPKGIGIESDDPTTITLTAAPDKECVVWKQT